MEQRARVRESKKPKSPFVKITTCFPLEPNRSKRSQDLAHAGVAPFEHPHVSQRARPARSRPASGGAGGALPWVGSRIRRLERPVDGVIGDFELERTVPRRHRRVMKPRACTSDRIGQVPRKSNRCLVLVEIGRPVGDARVVVVGAAAEPEVMVEPIRAPSELRLPAEIPHLPRGAVAVPVRPEKRRRRRPRAAPAPLPIFGRAQ